MADRPSYPAPSAEEMIQIGSEIEAQLTLGQVVKADGMRIAHLLMWAARQITEKPAT